MICSSKTEFLTSLRIALENNNVTDSKDILTDFRQHFEDGEAAGESEAEVCRKLGDIDDIIKQYITENEELGAAPAAAQTNDASGFGADIPDEPPLSQPLYAEPQKFTPDGGKIAGILILDILVYSWALPSLAGVIIGLIGTAIGISGSGIGIFFGGIVGFFTDVSGIISTGLLPASLAFLGLFLMSIGGMLVIASIASVRGFINICIAIVNHHARIFAGHNICRKIGRRYREAEAQ